MHKRNRQGEMGSPCLIPLEGQKGWSLFPLKRRDIEVVETQLRISLIMFSGNLKCVSTILMKPYSK